MRLAPVVVLLLLLASPVLAETNKEKAAVEYAEGQKQYNAKEYVKAAERFKAAWAADEDPVYLFNIAQALRLAKLCTESRDYYKKFLAAAGQDVPNRDKIDKWLAEVEACAATEKPVVAPPVDSPKTDPPKADPPKADPPRVDPPKEPTAPVDRGRMRRRLGLGVVAVGAVAAGIGIVFTTRVARAERDREALCPDRCEWSNDLTKMARDYNAEGKLNSKLAIASFAVGGAAIAGGIVLYVTGRSASKERVAVTPVPGGAVARVGFSF